MSDSVWISVNRPQIMRIFSVDENGVYSSKTDEGVSGQPAGGFFENRTVEHLEFIPKDQTVYIEYCCNVLKGMRETGTEAVQHNTTHPLREKTPGLDFAPCEFFLFPKRKFGLWLAASDPSFGSKVKLQMCRYQCSQTCL